DIMAAFQLHKEMYKIEVWFYEIYTSEQEIIPPYRHPKPNASPGIEDIKDIIKNALEENNIISNNSSKYEEADTSSKDTPLKEEENKEPHSKREVENGEGRKEGIKDDSASNIKKNKVNIVEDSSLLKEVSRLKDSAKEAIENANEFSGFKEYMH